MVLFRSLLDRIESSPFEKKVQTMSQMKLINKIFESIKKQAKKNVIIQQHSSDEQPIQDFHLRRLRFVLVLRWLYGVE